MARNRSADMKCFCIFRLFWSALINELKAARRDLWLAENKEAIDACNKLADTHGLFADKHRVF